MLHTDQTNDNLQPVTEQDLEQIEGGSWLDVALLVLVCVVDGNICA